MVKGFKEAYEELINKHLEEDAELLKELKQTQRYEKGLDGNRDEFKKLHRKQWQETKELCNKYGVKCEDNL